MLPTRRRRWRWKGRQMVPLKRCRRAGMPLLTAGRGAAGCGVRGAGSGERSGSAAVRRRGSLPGENTQRWQRPAAGPGCLPAHPTCSNRRCACARCLPPQAAPPDRRLHRRKEAGARTGWRWQRWEGRQGASGGEMAGAGARCSMHGCCPHLLPQCARARRRHSGRCAGLQPGRQHVQVQAVLSMQWIDCWTSHAMQAVGRTYMHGWRLRTSSRRRGSQIVHLPWHNSPQLRVPSHPAWAGAGGRRCGH